MLVFMCSTRFSGQILMKLEFVDRFLKKKYSNIKFYDSPSRGSRTVP